MIPDLTVVGSRPDEGSHIQAVNQDAVTNLASALRAALQIHPGRELIFVLGSGHEHSNKEALETWVRIQLEHNAIPPSRRGLTILITELERQLRLWELDEGR